MKKILLVASIVTAMVTASANAEPTKDHAYAGLDLIFSDEGHSNAFADDSDDVGFGLNLGYKMSSNDGLYFVAPEVFYDYLDSVIVYRLGAKVNFGYNFTQRFNGFVNIGVVNNAYDDTTPFPQSSYSSSADKVGVLYGLGFAYDLSDRWAAKLSYDWERFNIRYDGGASDRVDLGVLKLGAMYSF